MRERKICKKAVILAAGSGKRLYPLTKNTPKPLIKVNNKEIIINSIESLIHVGVNEFIIVTGYLGEKVTDLVNEKFSHFKDVNFIFIKNNQYEKTSNVYSLSLAKEYLDKDIFLLDADVYFSPIVLDKMLSSPQRGNIVSVSIYKSTMSGLVVSADHRSMVVNYCDSQSSSFNQFSTKFYKTSNIYLLDISFINEILLKKLDRKEYTKYSHYDEIIINASIKGDYPLFIAQCIQSDWIEIDDLSDLALAKYYFSPDEKKYDFIKSAHGSFWKYDFADHCLLYNIYFPPADFFSTLRNSLKEVTKYYPSNIDLINANLANYLEKPQEQVLISNGSSELIKIICGNLVKKIVIPIPTFNEYENAAGVTKVIKYYLNTNTFDIDANKFIELINLHHADYCLIVNPNNPTSLITSKSTIIKILKHTNCTLIVDESFIDFSDNPSEYSMENELENYKNLIIIKSISKSYGVGGIRLGYVLSSNTKLLESIRKFLPIWNINGAAELFINLLSRYKMEYLLSCNKVKEDIKKLYEELLTIPQLSVYYPQANFISCKLPSFVKHAEEVCMKLFTNYKILVKDCSDKEIPEAHRYIRIGCRTPEENTYLVKSLSSILVEIRD